MLGSYMQVFTVFKCQWCFQTFELKRKGAGRFCFACPTGFSSFVIFSFFAHNKGGGGGRGAGPPGPLFQICQLVLSG